MPGKEENEAYERGPSDSYARTAEEVLRELRTDLETGLDPLEAARRVQQYGRNALEFARKTPWYWVLARQFTGVLIVILFVAAVLAFAVGEVGDAVTILAIIGLNGILGFAQEWKAEKAMEGLQRMLSPHCKVVRDGHDQEIDARELVPGDIVPLEVGDRVPADLRLVESVNLKVDESALTGESVSVHKESERVPADAPLANRSSMAWMGTAVTNGRARGVAVAIGMATEFGRIAHLTQTVGEETTPLQRRLAVLAKQLGVFSIGISALVGAHGLAARETAPGDVPDRGLTGCCRSPRGSAGGGDDHARLGYSRHGEAPCSSAQASGGGGPGGGHGHLHRQDRDPDAERDDGYADLGALRKNPRDWHRLRPNRRFPGGWREDRPPPSIGSAGSPGNWTRAATTARLVEDEKGWHEFGDPTEVALVVAAYKAGLRAEDHVHAVSEFSFNSERKRMTVVLPRSRGSVAFVKGAPEVILERCSRVRDGEQDRLLTDPDREACTESYTRMAESGLRTLALALRQVPEEIPMTEEAVERDLTLLGVVGIIDPPHAEVPGAIRLAQQAGVKVVMITGDAAATALAIGRRVGLEAGRAITGSELSAMNDAELRSAIERDVVFARTTAEHKLRIVTLLQRLGHVVGMTGDGVNDAPALKKADIGIAMGLRGTDVAKGASDMVLTDDNFASIIGAIEEGRRQYDNIRKFVRYLLSSNTGEVIAIFFNILLGGPLILLPVQILWMNLVTDGMTAVALGVEPPEKGIMRRPPRAAREPILDRLGIVLILLFGGYIGAATLWLFHHYIQSESGQQVMLAQTMAFTGIIVLEKMNVFNFRALHEPMKEVGFFSNPWVLVAWAVTVGLQVCAVYLPFLQKALHTVPLGWQEWGLIFLVAAPIFIIAEAYKWLRWRRGRAESLLSGEEIEPVRDQVHPVAGLRGPTHGSTDQSAFFTSRLRCRRPPVPRPPRRR